MCFGAKLKRRICFIGFIIILLTISINAQPIYNYTVYKTDSDLVIDGKLEEAAWQAAPATERFVDYVAGDLLSLSTEVKMQWDSTYWYIGFICEDKDVWGTMTEQDDWLFQEEVVEIFADPDGDGKNYLELEVNPLNTIFDLKMSKPYSEGGFADAEWNIDSLKTAIWVYGTLNDSMDVDTAWTVEIAIPWDEIKFAGPDSLIPPKDGDTYRTLVTRNDFERIDDQTIERTCWIQMNDWNPHIPSRFGYTTFSDSTSLEYKENLNKIKRTAGYRASRVMPSPFPQPLYWSRVGEKIADKFTDATPAGLWIVSTYWDNGDIGLHFPKPPGGENYPHINFSWDDKNEAYLDEFDRTGVKVWLQVESGDADMETLIKLTLDRYKHHLSVIGFGVDIEWYYNNSTNYFGRAVTDEEAERWETLIKSYDSTYTLILKHFAAGYMPPTYRGDIIFINDSQDFPNKSSMQIEFTIWGNKFKNNKVGFQFGYDFDTNGDNHTDKTWWSKLDDPMKEIGDMLFNNISNCYGVYWVDFTIKEVFPVTEITDVSKVDNQLPDGFYLSQNYPNPFNPSTRIKYSIPVIKSHFQERGFRRAQPANGGGLVTMKVYNSLGQEVVELVNETKPAGNYEVKFDASNLPSGIYFFRLKTENSVKTNKMVLLK